MNCGKAAREGALGCDLGTPFVNSSAPAEPQGRTHPPQWASSEQPPQAALSESECSPTSRMILRCPGAHCAPLRDNVASGNISFNSLYRLISLSNNLFFPSDWARADLAFLRIGRVPAGIGYCRPWSHCHTRACPSGGGFALLREQPLNILEVVGLRASHAG